MSEQAPRRRLAAILAADVVGYSRLMEADEVGALAALKARRTEILQPLVSEHHGRIVKVMGDGVLVEFASAISAVQCALILQEAMSAANHALPNDRHITLRIGINLGDVMLEGSDLYGDGVNVAARLETLAEPGGICLSRKVRDEVAGKITCDFIDLGEQILKNIARPVQVYRIAAATGGVSPKAAQQIASVAVLPFTNLSGDASQEYFADGLTEDLITALAKSRHLSVLSRNATFQYKRRAVSPPEVGKQLGARYVLEGSIRTGGNRVRVNAQLIDAESGAHLWAEHFDRELADIFAVQDEIVQAILGQLGYALIDAVVAARRSAPSLTAYDHLLRGRSAWRRGAIVETRDAWLKAVEADPSYAAALASLAFFYSEDMWMQETGEPLEKLATLAQDYANRAIAADEGDAYAYTNLASALMNLGRLEEARHYLELALTLNPHFPNTAIILGGAIAFGGQHREGLAMIERAFHLEPRLSPTMRAVPFIIRCIMGDPDGAKSDLLNIDIDRPRAFLLLLMAACLASSGRVAEAKSYVLAFETKRPPWFDLVGFSQWVCKALALPEDKERFLKGLRQAGLSV
jgi:TolB-like protein/Tfp pilus assembly protein PilF